MKVFLLVVLVAAGFWAYLFDGVLAIVGLPIGFFLAMIVSALRVNYRATADLDDYIANYETPE